MSDDDFGHEAARGTIDGFPCFVDTWGSGPFVIKAKDKAFRFEDSDRFGPALCKRNGDICSNPYPAERSPFWRAHKLWKAQGRRIADDGAMCVYEWSDPRPTTYYKIGREMFVVEAGDDDGGYVEVPRP